MKMSQRDTVCHLGIYRVEGTHGIGRVNLLDPGHGCTPAISSEYMSVSKNKTEPEPTQSHGNSLLRCMPPASQVVLHFSTKREWLPLFKYCC